MKKIKNLRGFHKPTLNLMNALIILCSKIILLYEKKIKIYNFSDRNMQKAKPKFNEK